MRGKLKEIRLELQSLQHLSLNTLLLSPKTLQSLAETTSLRELKGRVEDMQKRAGNKGEIGAKEAAIVVISLFIEKTQRRIEAVLRYLQPILLSEPLEELMKLRVDDFSGVPEALPDCTNGRVKALYAEVLPVRFAVPVSQLREEKSGSIEVLKRLLAQTYGYLTGKLNQSTLDLIAVFDYFTRNTTQTSAFLQSITLTSAQSLAFEERCSISEPSPAPTHLSQLLTGLLDRPNASHEQLPSAFKLKADFTSYLSKLTIRMPSECRASTEVLESTEEDTEAGKEHELSTWLHTTSPQKGNRKRKAASWSLPACQCERDLTVQVTATTAKIRAIRHQSKRYAERMTDHMAARLPAIMSPRMLR